MNARVVRIGKTVHRSTGPHSPFVHALLRYLEQAEFGGAPRFIGIDEDGLEILSYIEGEVPHRSMDWSLEQLMAVTQLMRQMHDAVAGSSLAQGEETVCHLDIAPWNVVLQNDQPVAFIDFDDAAPGSRLDDLGYFFWVFLKLGDDTSPHVQRERMRILCDAYGISGDQTSLLHALQRQQERVLRRREQQAAIQGNAELRASAEERVGRIRNEMVWLEAHYDELAAFLHKC